MQETPEHDESYFASFTDMLVGIIFIFIILLMIVANNYQEATQAVVQSNQALQEARNKARDEARDKIHDAQMNQKIEELQTLAETRAMEAARALQEVKALEAAKAFQDAKAKEIASALQNTSADEDEKAKAAAKANEDVLIRQLASTQQNIFNDSRARILQKIQEALNRQGIAARANLQQGILVIPEASLFGPDWKQGELNYNGEQTAALLAGLLSKYLPCMAPTKDSMRLLECDELSINNREFTPNDGLDVIFIDNYPGGKTSREDKLLLSVQRTVSVFNALKANEPYLDKELKNIAGVPIIDIKVNQERRKAWDQQQNNPAVQQSVVLRFIMRQPNMNDVNKLRNEMQR